MCRGPFFSRRGGRFWSIGFRIEGLGFRVVWSRAYEYTAIRSSRRCNRILPEPYELTLAFGIVELLQFFFLSPV